jgi:hypothetical protein
VYDAIVRTTIDLRPDLHDKASSIARDTKRSLSETVNDLLARVLDPESAPSVTIDVERGLPVVHLDRIVTVDDVRALDDE